MRKAIFLFVFAICFAKFSIAQYHIISHSLTNNCLDVQFKVRTNGASSSTGYYLKMYFGDGSNSIVPADTFTTTFTHRYKFMGDYTIKLVLQYGSNGVDSLIFPLTFSGCGLITGILYNDINNNCIFDAGDYLRQGGTTIEVDSSGYAIDTIYGYSTFSYKANGYGLNYTFKILSTTNGFAYTCPASGISSAISSYNSSISAGALGFKCISTSMDIAIHKFIRPMHHGFVEKILLTSTSCISANGTVITNVDSKYPLLQTGGVKNGQKVTWIYNDLTSDMPKMFYVDGGIASTGWLYAGDTTLTTGRTSVIPGETDTTNNTFISIDTVRQAGDPNYIEVSPQGNVLAGSQLTYAIGFENTGNAPAQNIHILDTLPANLDANTLQMFFSSHSLNIFKLKDPISGRVIIDFDFPSINLPDTSFPGQNDGMVIFTINAKMNLNNGDKIGNEAGIYFDDNDVVMTNTVENIIGWPAEVKCLSAPIGQLTVWPNPAKKSLQLAISNWQQGENNSYTITDITGRQLLHGTVDASTQQIDISNLRSGMYFIQVNGYVRKFVKE